MCNCSSCVASDSMKSMCTKFTFRLVLGHSHHKEVSASSQKVGDLHYTSIGSSACKCTKSAWRIGTCPVTKLQMEGVLKAVTNIYSLLNNSRFNQACTCSKSRSCSLHKQSVMQPQTQLQLLLLQIRAGAAS